MVRSSTSRPADETGSSLVEVSVAMVVLVLAVVPLAGMLEAGLRAATSSGEYDAARALANERLEEVRALPYSRPGGGANNAVERYAPPGSPAATEGDLNVSVRTAFVDEDLSGPVGSPPTGQMRVEVLVTWDAASLDRRGRIGGAAVRRRLGGEDGFTLPEALVAMVMTAAVLLALYAVFDASVRVFGAARGNAEAAQAARLGLARMEHEIRAAYPRDKAGGDTTLLTNFGEERLDFGNDLDGDRGTFDPATGLVDPGEGISYTLDASGAPLRNGRLLVGSAGGIDGDGRALTFEYSDANGDPVVTGDEADVYLVRIELEVSADTGAGGEPVERVLRTAVALRNR